MTFFLTKGRRWIEIIEARFVGKEKEEFVLFSQTINEEVKEGGVMKKRKLLMLVLIAGLTITLTFSSAIAEEFSVLGRTLQLFGFATQGIRYGFKDAYDTEKG